MGQSDVTAIGAEAAMSIIAGMEMFGGLPGYDISELRPKTVIRMMTSEGPCTLAVVSPRHLKVVVFRHPAERFGGPRFATLRGAGLDGHLKVGWILAGAGAEFDLDNGARLLFRNIISMFPPEDGEGDEADILIAAAERVAS